MNYGSTKCKYMDSQIFLYSIVMIMQNSQEKVILQKMKVKAMKIRKFVADRNKLRTGKDWRPNVQ